MPSLEIDAQPPFGKDFIRNRCPASIWQGFHTEIYAQLPFGKDRGGSIPPHIYAVPDARQISRGRRENALPCMFEWRSASIWDGFHVEFDDQPPFGKDFI